VVLVGPGIGRWLLGVVRVRGDLAANGGWLIAARLVAFLGCRCCWRSWSGSVAAPFRSTGRYGLAVLLIVAAWSCSASAAGGQAAVVEEPGADAGAATGLPTAAAA
jgi:hypothetical protein